MKSLMEALSRAKYWKQRAKSAEGHLYAGDCEAGARAVHASSALAAASWDELTDEQRARFSMVAARVISAVNLRRDARKPRASA